MNWTQAWLKEQVTIYLNHEEPLYKVFADVLEGLLNQARDRLAPLAIVQARAKSPASFTEKCIRKYKEYQPQPVYQMTDLCGARIITNTLAEVDILCKFINEIFLVDKENSLDAKDRLRVSEFGYRAVHYVVQLPDVFPSSLCLTDDQKLKIQQINGPDQDGKDRMRKAEIQVRTQVQHVWADVVHDRIYKTKFKIPEEYKREAGRLAALLESADDGFGYLVEKIDAYKVDYGAYMTDAEMRNEIEMLKSILECNRKGPQADLVLQLARIARAAGLWDEILTALPEYLNDIWRQRAELKIEYGYALCKKYEKKPHHAIFRQGQSLIAEVADCSAVKNTKPRPDAQMQPPRAGTGSQECLGCVRRNALRARANALYGWSVLRRREGGFLSAARNAYSRAYQCDPSNPYHLEKFIECEAKIQRNLDFILGLNPQIDAAINKCREHVRVGSELPYCYFTMAKLYLFTGRIHQCMLTYAKAIYAGSTPFAIEEELMAILELQSYTEDRIPALEFIRKLLIIGKIAKAFAMRKSTVTELQEKEKQARNLSKEIAEKIKASGTMKTPLLSEKSDHAAENHLQEEISKKQKELSDMDQEIVALRKILNEWNKEIKKYKKMHLSNDKSPGADRHIVSYNRVCLTLPVVIIAGGTEAKYQDVYARYEEALRLALSGFKGTVFSGGTIAGIPGIVGRTATRAESDGAKNYRLYAYIPTRLPGDGPKANGYEHIVTGGDRFSYEEPLQNWIDMLANKDEQQHEIDPADVRLLGINGGEISEFEFYLALAMGAVVGLAKDSGRAAERLAADAPWWRTGQLLLLPDDAMTFRAMLFTALPGWEDESFEAAAKRAHEKYRESAIPKDISLSSWDALNADLKHSCYHQAIYAKNILEYAGFSVRPRKESDKESDLPDLTDPNVWDERILNKLLREPADVDESVTRDLHKQRIAKAIEQLAEMEHGRWNVERLMQGWRYDQEKDIAVKKTPYLIPWHEVPGEPGNNIKQYDIDIILNLPRNLWEAGWMVEKNL